MKQYMCWLFPVMFVCFLPVSAFSHGVKGVVEKGGIVVSAQYDSGDPMDYAKVMISAPNATLPFQSGRTDRNGRFCFFPDGAGQWKVVVDDEMGHRLEISVPIDEQLTFQKTGNLHGIQDAGMSKLGKAAVGVSIIFGFCGLFFWWKGARRATLH